MFDCSMEKVIKSYKELYNKQKVIKSYIKLYKDGRASFKEIVSNVCTMLRTYCIMSVQCSDNEMEERYEDFGIIP